MSLVEILKVLVLGIVEGFTEWLPISSTGHMILVDEFVKLDVSRDFWNMFLVVIQLGAVLAWWCWISKSCGPSTGRIPTGKATGTISARTPDWQSCRDLQTAM